MDDIGAFTMSAVMLATLASFTLSAAAGLGGSLILVPSLALVLGTKEGVALAAFMLGANNVLKVVAYRSSLPFRAAAFVVGMLTLGAAFGAAVLVSAPELLVGLAVIASFALSLIAERERWTQFRRTAAPTLAFASGATSGFSGTSGPLKGAALRNLELDRLHFVGAASLASLAGDLAKSAVFAHSSLLGGDAFRLLAMSVPLMFVGTYLGRRVNATIGESGFAVVFWSVMTGYSIRLVTIAI